MVPELLRFGVTVKPEVALESSPERTSVPSPSGRRTVTRLRLGVVLLITLLLGGWAFRSVHPFLATSAPVEARVLVVEGWLPDYALNAVVAEMKRGHYEHLYTTGGTLPQGSHLAEFRSHADLGAATLVKLGIDTNRVTAVNSGAHFRNRTYSSAVVLRDYCRAEGIDLRAINLVSLGAHARRSRLAFQRALGRDVKVGIISIESRDYDPRRWWRYSEGVKMVGGEILGLTYAWLTLDYGK